MNTDKLANLASIQLAHAFILELTGDPFMTFESNEPGTIAYSYPLVRKEKILERLNASGLTQISGQFNSFEQEVHVFEYQKGRNVCLEHYAGDRKIRIYLIDESLTIKKDEKDAQNLG